MPTSSNSTTPDHDAIIELESRVAFLEDHLDALNKEMSDLSQQFQLAKQVIRELNQKLEQASGITSENRAPQDEPPPPHY